MYLGIDIGTSAVKALVVDEAQRVTASATVPLSTSRPHDLWSEQDPADWWRAIESTIAALRADAGPQWSAIKAIGLSGQMHGAVLIDENGVPLRPAILWNDGRSFRQATELNENLPSIGTIAGVPAMASFIAPKILWLKAHEPDVLARATQILLPKDYVRYLMTGSFATDMADASGSLFLDSGKRAWSPEIANACGISLSLLPSVLEGSAVSGQLKGAVASAWGLNPGTIVATGAGDAAAGAVGLGAINEGDAFISMGTASQYFVARDHYRPAPQHLIHTFCHALPNRWFQMAAILNGASALAWAAELLGHKDIGHLLERTEKAFTGPSPVMFLPYLTGERTPHNNPHARGVLFGLTPSTTPEQVTQSVLEGVAFSLADCQAYVEETGPLPSRIAVNGGGARSRFWMRIVASALNRTVVLFEGGEGGPAFGAARLARLAVTGEDPITVCTKPAIAAAIEPEPDLSAAYRERLKKYQSLYRALVPEF
jgi:xylulokinase